MLDLIAEKIEGIKGINEITPEDFTKQLVNIRKAISLLVSQYLKIPVEENVTLESIIEEFFQQINIDFLKEQLSTFGDKERINERIKTTLAYYISVISAYYKWNGKIDIVFWDLSYTIIVAFRSEIHLVPYFNELMAFLKAKFPSIKNGILSDISLDVILKWKWFSVFEVNKSKRA
ncbi:hypothetical protein A2335_02120 [Candidatus Peregrinibacteria bacterium RIFOXYB2_FULL_32_7]|nr:MAG: hypothetical protein A2335_02120 [Candidatus Peregrinibacteria bacterium RIFOXYB2_FULL_32_7]